MSPSAIDTEAVNAAARLLEQGALVAFPTETVYGLGADAENPEAVARIYAAKGRPSNHPVIVHLAPEADLGYWAESIPDEARQLIAAFWPGPLTLILKRAAHIPDCVSGGQDSIGLRCPSHPVAQALLRAFKDGKGGIAAPSANKFGHVSPTTTRHVQDEFGVGAKSEVQCILDGGQSDVGIESTIIDLSRIATHGPVLLRPGRISAADIAGLIGTEPKAPDLAAPRVSGALDSHYAPNTPVALIDSSELATTLQKLMQGGHKIAVIHRVTPRTGDAIAELVLPESPEGYAHDLYAALRLMDRAGADLILVEVPPRDIQWQGVNDRLDRAGHDSAGIIERLLPLDW